MSSTITPNDSNGAIAKIMGWVLNILVELELRNCYLICDDINKLTIIKKGYTKSFPKNIDNENRGVDK